MATGREEPRGPVDALLQDLLLLVVELLDPSGLWLNHETLAVAVSLPTSELGDMARAGMDDSGDQVVLIDAISGFMQNIVQASSQGEEKMPNWPEISGFWEDLVIPFFRFGIIWFLCLGPGIAVMLFVSPMAGVPFMLEIAFAHFTTPFEPTAESLAL